MAPARDMYDALPADRGAHLRRRNLERLAELEARGAERRARLVRAVAAAGLGGRQVLVPLARREG
jgi:hypothetical protein